MKVPRGTETGDAPGWQGARSENTGQYLNDEQRRQAGVPDAAAALGWSPDAAPVECSGTFTTGC